MSARAIVFTVLAASVTAQATPTFTGLIETELGRPPPGTCGVCHAGGIGMVGNVTTPFGRAMRMAGLMPNDEATLTAALNALRTANTDSDGDGCTDIAELSANSTTSPNRADCSATADGGSDTDGGMGGGTAGGAGGGGTTLPPISYGCGSDVTPGALAILAVVLLALFKR